MARRRSERRDLSLAEVAEEAQRRWPMVMPAGVTAWDSVEGLRAGSEIARRRHEFVRGHGYSSLDYLRWRFENPRPAPSKLAIDPEEFGTEE